MSKEVDKSFAERLNKKILEGLPVPTLEQRIQDLENLFVDIVASNNLACKMLDILKETTT